jgi:DNA-binding MarR family transcriptional regulator
MDSTSYREMRLLDHVAQRPEITQRELANRLGIALGLTNLMLRRLTKKGYIKIRNIKRHRLRYLITPKGILEKSRLTYEFVQYSLQLYHRVRHFWRERLASVSQAGHRRILLVGTGELAEIAFLTIREMGLEFVGVVEESADHRRFLGYPVQDIHEIAADHYDRILVASLQDGDGIAERMVAQGVPKDRIITLPHVATPKPVEDHRGAGEERAGEVVPKHLIPVPAPEIPFVEYAQTG